MCSRPASLLCVLSFTFDTFSAYSLRRIAQDMHEAGRKTGPAMAEAAESAAVAEPVREEAKKEEAKAEEAKKDEGEAAPKK